MNIKKYIFLTNEGYTFQPESESQYPDIENIQVIGIAEGLSASDALKKLITERPSLLDTSFESIFSYQLDSEYGDNIKYFDLTKIKTKCSTGAYLPEK